MAKKHLIQFQAGSPLRSWFLAIYSLSQHRTCTRRPIPHIGAYAALACA
ncbi:hypothetical protein [Xanthomonas theicola]|nr:hypothetical protein [Xanthomonas theicola]QNH24719.1 hypothetical protein G4Q83_08155 [Xanthomonas theicola]